MKILSVFLFLTLAIFAKAQDTIDHANPTIYVCGTCEPDSMRPEDLDTIRAWVTYVDTTMTTGSKIVKVNGVSRIVYYQFPVHPEVKYKVAWAIVLKRDTSHLVLVNDHTNEWWTFTVVKYLDEAKVPFLKKYMVLLTKALNYDYGIP